jgi:hypothetical protein
MDQNDSESRAESGHRPPGPQVIIGHLAFHAAGDLTAPAGADAAGGELLNQSAMAGAAQPRGGKLADWPVCDARRGRHG